MDIIRQFLRNKKALTYLEVAGLIKLIRTDIIRQIQIDEMVSKKAQRFFNVTKWTLKT